MFAVKNGSNSRSNGYDSKAKYPRKDCPICQHCSIVGHAKDMCFKLHGYPPNYKKSSSKPVNSVSQDGFSSSNVNLVAAPFDDTLFQLTFRQYHQLMSLL